MRGKDKKEKVTDWYIQKKSDFEKKNSKYLNQTKFKKIKIKNYIMRYKSNKPKISPKHALKSN